MARGFIIGGGGVCVSDDCTAGANDVVKGKTAIYNGSNDEVMEGTLELTGNVTAEYVYNGRTFYNTDPHVKLTGKMTVGSILNFSAAAYSGRQVLLKWQNPYAAAGRPFAGVFINYSTTGYPGTGGTRIYTGYGDNTSSGGWSQVIVTMPALATTYYFSCTAYATSSIGDMWGNTLHAVCATGEVIVQPITHGQNYVIPSGYSYADIFCVGGGGGGTSGYVDNTGSRGAGGGGGGYTATVKNISISPGQILTCSVGAGGANQHNGGASSVSSNGIVLCTANGGNAPTAIFYGGNGGSGGGMGGPSNADGNGRAGGTNGGNGIGASGSRGLGQGYTTTAFAENAGTVYSGGGGGGGYGSKSDLANKWGGLGGVSGGGGGGTGQYGYNYATNGYNGTANTGGGGGGAGGNASGSDAVGGAGGSGIIIIRLH